MQDLKELGKDEDPMKEATYVAPASDSSKLTQTSYHNKVKAASSSVGVGVIVVVVVVVVVVAVVVDGGWWQMRGQR